MSSAIVYGDSAPIGKEKHITKDTPPSPAGYYGDSKLQAEKGILPMQDETFHVVILRPPMIYGEGCKGNYPTLSTLARKLPVFPWVENRRSMLYMDNLSELIRLLIDEEAEGIFCPQNEEYVNTCDMVNLIAHTAGKNILMIHGFGWALKLLRRMTPMVDKAFGSLCYDRELSAYPGNYCVKSFEQSVLETERE
jgi:UDP-glucose 4-epimerase